MAHRRYLMNSKSSQIEELYRLLIEAGTGKVSPEDQQKLNGLLKEDSSKREEAARFLRDEALLIHELRTEESSQLFVESGLVGPQASISMPDRRNTVGWKSLMAVAATAVAAVLFLWFTDRATKPSSPGTELQIPVASASRNAGVGVSQTTAKVCATLTSIDNCEWNNPISLGDHLYIGDYVLKSGTAGIHFLDGATLYFDGPARFEIHSAQHVCLVEGNVIADISEQAVGFRLETPSTNVVDVGTAFSVTVDASGSSQVEVINGTVLLLPVDGTGNPNPPLIVPGSVNHFDESGVAIGNSISDPADSRARLEHLSASRDANRSDLLAYEDFDHESGRAPFENSGFGWSSPWMLGFKKTSPGNIVIRSGQNIGSPVWLRRMTDRYAVCPTGNVARRSLATPLDMSVDATYYISYLSRTRIVSSANRRKTGSGLTLRSTVDRSAGIGMSIDWQQHLTTWSGEQRWFGEKSITPDESILVVMKITSRKLGDDTVQALSLNEDSLPLVREPREWESECEPVRSDAQMDEVLIWCGACSVSLFGDLRIGKTWDTVVPMR